MLSTSIGLSKKGNNFILNEKAWKPSHKIEERKKGITYFKGINARCQDAVYNKKDKVEVRRKHCCDAPWLDKAEQQWKTCWT